MAHKKAGGSTGLGRDSKSKRLGVKLFSGQFATAGSILVRQRGEKIIAGQNVQMGKDDTLFATTAGFVKFSMRKRPNWYGKLLKKKTISIIPENKKA